MSKQAKWRESYQQLKKVIEKLVKQKPRTMPQPALQPYRPKQRF